jgi:hypothetical protein
MVMNQIKQSAASILSNVKKQIKLDSIMVCDSARTYAGTLYIAYCRHEILHTIIGFFQINITFNISSN